MVCINGLVTMEDFLETVMKGFGKKTRTQHVSIVSHYGGTNHSPISLMKCHACRAIDILVKNCIEYFDYTTFMPLGKT